MKDFLTFIKCPTYSESFKAINWKMFSLLLFLSFLIAKPLGLVAKMAANQWGFKYVVPPFASFSLVLLFVLFAPVFEEIFHRLFLVFNKKNLYISVCCGIFLGCRFYLSGSYSVLVIVAPIVVVGILAILYFNKSKSLVVKRYGLFFYLTVVLFGLMHIFNYSGITMQNVIFTVLLVMPQLLMGVVLGYVRVSYGLAYSIFFHAIFNSPALLFLLR